MKQPKVYIKSLDMVLPVEVINYHEKTVEVYFNDNADNVPYDFDEVELIENTGIKDKNGKYIYVGDIVKFDDEFPTWDYEGELSACDGFNVAIVTKEKNFITLTNFQADDGGLEEMLFTRDLIISELNFEDFEVIGNIYENKELLEE
jgi:hypothetical protein|nr:MAG TPA: YopX protein [Caudoviricetes sp.]